MKTRRHVSAWLMGAVLLFALTSSQPAAAQDIEAVSKRLAKAVSKGEISWEHANVMLGALQEFRGEHERHAHRGDVRADRPKGHRSQKQRRGKSGKRGKGRRGQGDSARRERAMQEHEGGRDRPPRSRGDRQPPKADRRPPMDRQPPRRPESDRGPDRRRPAGPPRESDRRPRPDRRMDGPARREARPMDRPPARRGPQTDRPADNRENRERARDNERKTDDRGRRPDRPQGNRADRPRREKIQEDIEIEMQMKDGKTLRTTQFEIVLQNLEKRLKDQVEEGKISEERAEQMYDRVRKQMEFMRDRQKNRGDRDKDDDE